MLNLYKILIALILIPNICFSQVRIENITDSESVPILNENLRKDRNDIIVLKSSNTTLDGIKTFSEKSIFSSGATINITPTISTDAVNKNYVDTIVGSTVDKSTDYGAQISATNGFVAAFCDPGTGQSINLFTDSNTDPVLLVASADNPASTHGRLFICGVVKKGNYWKITVGGGTPTVFFTPIGN